MRQIIIRKSGNVSYGINGIFIDRVLTLRNKGIRSPLMISGLVGIPVSHVSKILKVNRRN